MNDETSALDDNLPPMARAKNRILIALLCVFILGIGWYNWIQIRDEITGRSLSRLTPHLPDVESRRVPNVQPIAEGFQPRTVIPYAFPPIEDIPFIAADAMSDENGDVQLRDDELVLGIRVGDQSRAYPINMLTGPSREILNDNLGGVPLAATW